MGSVREAFLLAKKVSVNVHSSASTPTTMLISIEVLPGCEAPRCPQQMSTLKNFLMQQLENSGMDLLQ